MNASITTLTLESPLTRALFPAIRAPKSYKAGTSSGKLKGAIIATGP
jgi:hypothetical protein